MTLQRDEAELFGLSGTLPRPAWVILDAARDHRFTGELVFHVDDPVAVYLDRGEIYLAESASEHPFAARLIDAGALNSAQLERGAIRVGDVEHLGRLFDRVPTIDREFVVLVTELMNETRISTLAREQVGAVEANPYRHHPAGIHHWFAGESLRAGDPLPAPAPDDAPVAVGPPDSLFDVTSNDTDPLILWDERSWLDETAADGPSTTAPETPEVGAWMSTDWADRLTTDGLPEPEDDPLAAPAPLPPVRTNETLDRFELIWPSGDVDETFGSSDAVDGDDDRDRVGPTVRITRRTADSPEDGPGAPSPELDVTEPPADLSADRSARPEDVGADMNLAVRRAVASVDIGSLDARRRLAAVTPTTTAHATPERAVEQPAAPQPSPIPTSSVWSVRTDADPSRSVFAEVGLLADTPSPAPATADASPLPVADEAPRTSALRRLIGGLRRR